MIHFTCDLCGKEICPEEDQRYVVKIEAFSAQDPTELTEADLDDDHMQAIGELLQELDGAEEDIDLPAPAKHLRYDLCHECHGRFMRDPLSKEHAHKLFFSEN